MTNQPEWTEDVMCPDCGEQLAPNWEWEYHEDYGEYRAWFLVCEECEENFSMTDKGQLFVLK